MTTCWGWSIIGREPVLLDLMKMSCVYLFARKTALSRQRVRPEAELWRRPSLAHRRSIFPTCLKLYKSYSWHVLVL
jgi:hypothetical protein